MDNLKLWLTNKSFPHDTMIRWGFDLTQVTQGYRFSPNFTSDGTNMDSTASTGALQLTRFSVFAWVRLNAGGNHTTDALIANKGGIGSDSAGQNMNYGLNVRSDEKIEGGFEEADGTDHFIRSPVVNNDGIWHPVLITFGTTGDLKLYIDDPVTPVASTNVGAAVPESSGTNPFVIGRNSRAADRFLLSGEQVDEVRVWNRELDDEDERVALFEDNIANPTGLVLEKKFGADDYVLTAQTITDKYTEPLDIDWHSLEAEPAEPNVGKLLATKSFPTWLHLHVNANAAARIDDNCLFFFNFDIPSGGTGSGGSGSGGGGSGGSGGNPPGSITNYKVAVSGDWGCESETDDVIALINSQGYNKLLGVGDNSYDGSASCWTTRFSPLKSSGVFTDSTMGNHEYEESAGINPYKTFFGITTTYYSRIYQNMLIIIMDSNISLASGSAQHTFVKNTLETYKNDPTIQWRVVIEHHPWFGSDSDHSYDEFNQVETYHQLFITNKVNFVFVGHNHNYQRTHQVAYNASDPENPTIVASSSPYSASAAGLIHVVSGCGGHDHPGTLYDLDTNPSFNAFQANDNNGVFEMVASNNGMTLTCGFRDTAGDLHDSFVINS